MCSREFERLRELEEFKARLAELKKKLEKVERMAKT
jgi:hypothetical protein